MLVYFEVGGFLSFNEPQIVYFTPSPGARIVNTKYEKNFIIPDSKNIPRVMKSAVLFGDNASGKTNWFYALESFKRIIKNGLEREFDTDFNFESENMRFSIAIIEPVSRNIFEYTLEFNKSRQIIYEEFIFNNDLVFKYEDKKLSIDIKLNKKNELVSLFNTVNSTDTFLSKLEDFIPDYIKSFVDAISSVGVVTESAFNEEIKYLPQIRLIDESEKEVIDNYKKEIVEILSDLDPTIDDFDYTKREAKDKVGYDLVIKRKDHKYDISYESQGIRKIVNLLIDILGIFEGNTVLIDELDSSIGAKALIRIFNSIVNSNKNLKGQLIISSHNLILMDFDSFHASQLYVFSKDCNYQTIIRSIDDYELRYEKKNLPSLYLNGSFEVY
ncbi:ATP-binding protein [Anaerococcus sp.]|uniref:AAA family ATPase n=1 Tax=Anaerococcus sp. TaxID=1872515 RepID=UPI0029046960|nr:ATP-binding protein [Anaerococcus sp.]MDU1827998.1 ATP-binding protein [Anaerococcus sp.]MDU1863856.1 ATP-binding protein [Anaerococcus sp.]